MDLPNGTDCTSLDEILGKKTYGEKVEVEVGWLLALFSDLHYLQGKVEGMEDFLNMQKELIKD